MSTLVSRNTMRLANDASGASNYYVGYSIIVRRVNQVTGKELVQKKVISGYDAAAKVITIDSIWDPEFIPGAGDSYEIVPTYADARVSINPAMQTLDYITSDRYGRGLHPTKDLDLPSWLQSGRDCDARSDITVEMTSVQVPSIGAIYRYPASGNILWQGKVKSIDGRFIRFTDNIGKLTNKWNNWKNFPSGSLVYHNDQLYTANGVMTNEPSGAGIGTLALTSTTGGPTLYAQTNGNPIRAKNAAGITISGYSLYDSDGVDYWRHIGWDEHDQRYVTRHQTNLAIDTSAPIFDNTNNLLSHFGGILRYHNGKYYLEVEQGEGEIANSDTEVRNISAEYVIGKVRISDDGIRSAYNSLTVAYADPANKFEARNISFFNSDFLKADRNVPRKGSLSIPGITNYYNARLVADKYLIQSRYGMNISFNMEPRGVLLLAGRVFQFQHPKYGWSSKKFRISDLTHNTDCTVDVVATEYDDSFHAISNVSKQPASGLAAERARTTIPAPAGLTTTNITAENEVLAGIELKWVNHPAAIDSPNVSTEIYSSVSPNLYLTITGITLGSRFEVDEAHLLKKGEIITSKSGIKGLEDGRAYYVKETPSPTSFTLSDEKDGAEITTFENGTGLDITFLTATMVAAVPMPENTYIDAYTGNEVDRIEKFYWIRYRIIQNG